MRQLIYAMRFEGQATPSAQNAQLLKAATTAPSSTLTVEVGPNGLSSRIESISGDNAVFTSEVTFSDETTFLETGAITFGGGNVLRFTTVERGYLGPSSDPLLKHGAVMWRVEDGEGQFAGARGLITSNFFVSDQLAVIDHHFGVLFLP